MALVGSVAARGERNAKANQRSYLRVADPLDAAGAQLQKAARSASAL